MIQESATGERKSLLPIPSIVMSFSLRGAQAFVGSTGRESIPSSGVSGLRRSARAIELERGAQTLLVFFREGGAFAVLGAPLHELFEAHPSLRDLMGSSEVARIEEELAAARTSAERVARVERFLLASLKACNVDPLIAESVHRINKHGGSLRIRELIEDLPISLDAYEKRFKRQVGTTPKHFSSLVQMRSAIDHYALEPSLIEAALSAGYFDQPHFTREFKRFTGLTPREYFRGAPLEA